MVEAARAGLSGRSTDACACCPDLLSLLDEVPGKPSPDAFEPLHSSRRSEYAGLAGTTARASGRCPATAGPEFAIAVKPPAATWVRWRRSATRSALERV